MKKTRQNIALKSLEANTGQLDWLPKNPRQWTKDDLSMTVESIREDEDFLEDRPLLVVGYGDKFVVFAGNLRLTASRKLKLKDVPCVIYEPEDDVTDPQTIRRRALKDNGSFGSWDADTHANQWDNEKAHFDDWGLRGVWSKEDQAAEEAAEETATVKNDNFDVPIGSIEVRCKKGDVWILGEHRLMCGDSISLDDVKKLVGGGTMKIDIGFTSPPYNAGKTPTEAKRGRTSKYANDADDKSGDDYLKLLVASTQNALAVAQFAFVNVQQIAGNKTQLIDFMSTMKEHFADTIIWDKESAQPAMGQNVLNSEFEFVHVFSEKATRAIGVKPFRGTLSNMLHLSNRIGRDSEVQKIHSATFPLDLAAHFISNFSRESVIDLFCGSGTTLIAAQQLGRRCYAMEIDPRYCDVIIARWEKFTGQTARLET